MRPLRAEWMSAAIRTSVSLAVAAALALPACGGGGGPDDPPPPLTVSELLDQFAASYQAKDAAAIADMCRFPFELEGVALESAAQLEQLLATTFEAAGTYEVVEILDGSVSEAGDTATATGTLRVVDSTYGESSTAFTIEAVRVNGQWKATRFTRG